MPFERPRHGGRAPSQSGEPTPSAHAYPVVSGLGVVGVVDEGGDGRGPRLDPTAQPPSSSGHG
eukprot:9246016-Lingulodinium_polyedra.AAC.1